MVGARAGSPLLVGVAEHDHYLASDASALSSVTKRVVYLEEGDIADVTREAYTVYDTSGARVSRPVVTVKTSGDSVELGVPSAENLAERAAAQFLDQLELAEPARRVGRRRASNTADRSRGGTTGRKPRTFARASPT